MPDENPTHESDYDVLARETVYLMTSSDQPPIWTLPDIGRELVTHDPEALVGPLVCAGLLHRTGDGHVFATPAAFKWVQLVGHVI